jgi:POT family proton-dependent oligopeptide transporter
LVGKLAPKRFASLLYGVFFISNAAGYALAGSLGAIIPATGDKFEKAEKIGVNLQDVLDKKVTLSTEQLALFEKEQLPVEYTSFGGFEIHNLYEFFMVFVILCGIAAVILALLSPRLKKMMNGMS